MKLTAEKRFLSLLLAIVMVAALIPWSVVEVHAAITNANALGGKLWVTADADTSYISATGTDGNSFTFNAKGQKSTCGTSKQKIEFILENTSQTDAIVFEFNWTKSGESGSFTDSNGNEVSSNPVRVELAAGGSTKFTLTSAESTSNSALTINNFVEIVTTNKYNVTVKPDANGSVTINDETTAITSDRIVEADMATGVKLTATAGSGYTFSGWTDENGTFVSNANPYTVKPEADVTIQPKFISTTVALTILMMLANMLKQQVQRQSFFSTTAPSPPATILSPRELRC